MKKHINPYLALLALVVVVGAIIVYTQFSSNQSASIFWAPQTPSGIATLGWKNGHCHNFRDGVDLGETTINFSQGDCHAIRPHNNPQGFFRKSVTTYGDPASVISYESSSGSCLVWRYNSDGSRDYMGTVNLSGADCHAIRQAPSTPMSQ